jgi:hypothetical protein
LSGFIVRFPSPGFSPCEGQHKTSIYEWEREENK